MGCCSSAKLELTSREYIDLKRDLIVSDGSVENLEDKLNKTMYKVLELAMNKHKYKKRDQEIIDELYENVKKRYHRIKQWKSRRRNLTWPRR